MILILKPYIPGLGIEMIFPTESKDTYYTPYCRSAGQIQIPTRGKLYNKYCNLKKEIKKIEAPATIACVTNDDENNAGTYH